MRPGACASSSFLPIVKRPRTSLPAPGGTAAIRDLQDALRRLLEVYDPANENLAVFAPPAAVEAPQVQILQPEGAAQPLSGHVLLVEDNDVNRQVAQRLLTLSGVSFSVAENGKEAVDALAGRSFDVLMDCRWSWTAAGTRVSAARNRSRAARCRLSR